MSDERTTKKSDQKTRRDKSAPKPRVGRKHTEVLVAERKARHYQRCNVKGGRRASTRGR
jgi:hypothetical protein